MGRDVTAFVVHLHCRSAQLWGISAGRSKAALPGRDWALGCVGRVAALTDLQHLVPAHTLAPDGFRKKAVLKLGDKLSL